ncbi:MAG: SDR family oxidoreductase [Rhodospirillales bacterium]|jgi:NAD(P)-dependent dehydrogenase (short-subunit alcohol dehydrogenase family)|nr:SDR family oxidoreductase [Rhodospirillales bacterium]|tara:strand:- start:4899 stop:5696 length:798 start_codon:yes stop_codon:yes gene_type:complete
MAERFKDKVAVVVGAGATPGDEMGNGRATAILFAREGASVVLADHRGEAAEETKAMIDAEGGTSSVIEADVTSAGDCERIAAESIKAYGRIDILHNNVGIGGDGGPVETSEEDWDKVINVNLKGMFLTCKYVLPHMVKQGGGAIVNISSIGAIRCTAMPMVAYNTSKAGVVAFTRSVAMQYAAQGIRANAIMPGVLLTSMAMHDIDIRMPGDREEVLRAGHELAPMNHMGEAWDVAKAAMFLASDDSKYITGVALPVDGGLSLKF